MLRARLLVLAVLCSSQWAGGHNPGECLNKESCSDCIRVLGCTWCAQPINKNETMERCRSAESLPPNWCPAEFMENPKGDFAVLKNVDLGGASKVQIQPQHIRMSLRQGEEREIRFRYREAEDYPVDLYYLMDLSSSMLTHRDSLSKLGAALAKTMRNMTNNFRLGFGSFVDKPIMPFAVVSANRFCDISKSDPCNEVFSFKNNMPLSENEVLFSKKVREAPMSTNLDYPEGGLDGLMQVMVCKKEINWREGARKLVVFSTDAGFHMAGDGKLAGIVEPNDELCHLNENGFYTDSLNTDYPSVSQIDKIATENNINIIFAVDETQQSTYGALKAEIKGSGLGILKSSSHSHEDESNVVKLVKHEYEKILGSISIADNSTSDIEIKYFSNCGGNFETEHSVCNNIRGRPVIEFKATIKAVACSADPSEWKRTIEIKQGALTESLVIEVETLCDCSCERKQGEDRNRDKCSSNGDLMCGKCQCDQYRSGHFCECDRGKAGSTATNVTACTQFNSSLPCSGFGVCRCGKCECYPRDDENEKIYGPYCECDNYSCQRNGNLLCSGPEHGHCECGVCKCLSGWSGNSCQCHDTNATCIAPGSSEVCSGHGECSCGACKCELADKFHYSGHYCEECPNCETHRCDELRPCVECLVHKSGVYDESECKLRCDENMLTIVEKIEPIKDDPARICPVPDDAGCTIKFKYVYEDDNISLKVFAQRTKQCAVQINLIALILGVVGGTVLAGLVLLIVWKIATSVHDKREYSRFEKERALAKWDRGDNPLYKPSTTTFKNPTFAAVK